MAPCPRFESEGLLAQERGEALDRHMETCSECLAAREQYTVLERLLAETPNWEREVWRELGESGERVEEPATRSHAFFRPVMTVLLAAAAAVTLWCAVDYSGSIGPKPRAELALRTTTIAPRAEAKRVRGATTAARGTTLTLEAQTGDYPVSELRVYRDQHQLELVCSTEPPCRRDAGTISAAVTLEKFGRYQAILVVGDKQLPQPTGDLESDVAQASKAGRVVFAKEISIR